MAGTGQTEYGEVSEGLVPPGVLVVRSTASAQCSETTFWWLVLVAILLLEHRDLLNPPGDNRVSNL